LHVASTAALMKTGFGLREWETPWRERGFAK
jgi:hypothetical protein